MSASELACIRVAPNFPLAVRLLIQPDRNPLVRTEFVNGIAAMARSGAYGPCEIAAGISSTADLTLGAAVEPVLRAHMVASPNFCGIRWVCKGSLP